MSPRRMGTAHRVRGEAVAGSVGDGGMAGDLRKYDPVESEFAHLGERLPVVATVLAYVTAIGTETRALMS